MARLDWLEAELSQLRQFGLLRDAKNAVSRDLIDVSSNDYLGYARAGVSRETLLELGTQIGAGSSRLISGTHPAHQELEQALADWVQVEETLAFSSGYLANVSTLCALVGKGDLVLSDQLNHASIVDGCRLSRASVRIYPHLDLQALQQGLAEIGGFRRVLVVTESYFSMDGDGPDLPALAALCSTSGAMLMLDEAHSLGVFGPRGGGRALQANVTPDVLVGTFGKAIGTQGAFVGGPSHLRQWLWNKARGFGFSTAISPLLAALTADALKRLQRDDRGRARLAEISATFEKRLKLGGVPLSPARFGPIFPIILGSNERALQAAAALERVGYQTLAIRPPTVAAGSARLRISLNSTLSDPALERLADEIIPLCA